MAFKERRGTVVAREIPLIATLTNMALTLEFEPGRHWWEGSALTTAPQLLP